MLISQEKIETNKKKMLERKEVYKQYGYDQDASRNFILDKSLPLKKPILEIGTGKGHMTVLLAKNAGRMITVDNSLADQEFARLNVAAEKVLDNVRFVVFDAAQLSYPDQGFGTVISVNAFHHFEKPFAVLAEMIRVCREKIVIADFNQEGFEMIRKLHRAEGHEHEERCGDFSLVGQYIEEYGFVVKKYDGCGQVMYVGEKSK
ncbi:hypothetical protein COT42_07065 [Candidatus Saganbacteria bacterium CG08_land_8_20_14_0_20_45_16]|uniref:Methyltransferase domain-containing protein n=1 Tax=Candidatus Saganbacteria bacterium CG08_land_8_20_14_0_20_45_16 TaxID=2014293 RepID=A0A2H0XV10_UNCSA|nr:MAG: hypothetical protein COT42_07065 [Candidatus Saganbacteria bacterium CG08_land_8_20_14_0_20_45_16]